MAESLLTPRQIEIVMHLANGMRVDEIASTLHLSVSTVEKTIKVSRRRTNARTVAHLVSIAIANDLLEWNEDNKERDFQRVPPVL